MVCYVYVSWAHLVTKQIDLALDGIAHAPKEDRHVRGIRNQIAVGTENGAGKIESLFDVQ